MGNKVREILKTVWEDGADVEFDCGRNTKEVMKQAGQALLTAVLRCEPEKMPEDTIGKGCTCAAYGECECGCDADWTDYSIYNRAIDEYTKNIKKLFGEDDE